MVAYRDRPDAACGTGNTRFGHIPEILRPYYRNVRAAPALRSVPYSPCPAPVSYTHLVTSGLARIQALEAGEKSSRAAVEANRTGYEVGVRINLDVLNAQQQLYATQRDLALARYSTVLSGLRLKRCV